jgi:hypothetical protein
MKALPWRHLVALFALALAVRLLTAWLLDQPGYTDAYYYAVGAQQLYEGQGFDEPFVWNYLDPPESVPHPGYRYWMPLAAILGWLGMSALGPSFGALQVPFVLLSSLLPLVAYVVAWDLTCETRHALLAGLLAVVPGFYTHVLVLPDNFAPFALAGSICLWASGRGLRGGRSGWFGLAGLAAGFGHLGRADGLLLVVVALAAALAPSPVGAMEGGRGRGRTASVALILIGYLVVMGPWYVRNWSAFGAPLAGGGLQTMFLTNYDNMFTYGQSPTLEHYLDWGWGAILQSKLDALLLNLQRLWVENLLIVLLPLSALGLWRLRRDRLLWPFLLYLPLLFLAMTFVFTFPGTRGGLYHSGGALLPFFFAATGPGLEGILRWAARRLRRWHVRRAWPVFAAGLVGLAAMVSLLALWRTGVLTGDWNERAQRYVEIDEWLASQGAEDAIVMAGDAPAFAWQTGHQCVAIPNDPLDTVVDVADRYDVRYLVLDQTRTRTTDALYAGGVSNSRLQPRLEAEDRMWLIFEIRPRLPSLSAPQ